MEKTKKDVVYRCIGSDLTNGILACGFMPKATAEQSQYNFMIDYYSGFLLLSGSGRYCIPDREIIPIRAGDFVQRIPGVCHSTEITPDGSWVEFFISFGRTTYNYLCSLNLLPADTPVIHSHFDENRLQQFSRFLHQLKTAEDNELPFLSLKAQETVLSIVNRPSETSPVDSVREAIEQACRLLSCDIHKVVSLEEAAAALHMSYENFRKQFRKYVGVSPLQYRIDQKMKHAKLMILSGVSIKETALLTGYSDAYSFTKQFTRSVGISPGRFKQKP
ncbi:MAG: transcriptional regulator, AraC family [Eubacterium sp.]|nr:transcriptional regulator, AraC family [Eubacterium sp.]